jgi:hypothetical protein
MIVLDERVTEAYARPSQAAVSQATSVVAPEAARRTTGRRAGAHAHGTLEQLFWRAITRALMHKPMLRMCQVGLGGY